VTQPRKYYLNNVVGTLNLVHALADLDVDKLVFSSSCATFGDVGDADIHEDMPQHPTNPYGATKLMVERVLADYGRAYRFGSVSLRYFNAAGAALDGALRERHQPELHLVPLVLAEAERVLSGGDPAMTTLTVFGTDYPTPDGSCVRDYIHVEDLCRAHLLALERLLAGRAEGAEHYNLGTGRGTSVLELIAAARRVTGADLRYRVGARRSGDPARLVASSERALEVLGWRPELTSLDLILLSAWHASYPHRR
jgi:UDP-glucose-4-epimerase GalE